MERLGRIAVETLVASVAASIASVVAVFLTN